MSWAEVPGEKLMEPPVLYQDFVRAVKKVRPSVNQDDIKLQKDWTEQFGEEGWNSQKKEKKKKKK